MFYSIAGGLKEEAPEEAKGGGFVAVLSEQEIARNGHGLLRDLSPTKPVALKTARFCKLETEAERLVITLCRPPRGDQRARLCIAAVLHGGNLLLIDDTGFSGGCIEKIRELPRNRSLDAGRVLCEVLNLLIRRDLEVLEGLENRAAKMETAALSGSLEKFDHGMMAFRKEVSALLHYYAQLADVSVSLREHGTDFFTPEEQETLHLFSERVTRLREEAMMLREYSVQIREVYQAQIGIRQNEIMKILTAVTAVFLPLSLIAGWYGMNFTHMPELHWRYGYGLVALVSAGVAAFCIWFFKKKKFW